MKTTLFMSGVLSVVVGVAAGLAQDPQPQRAQDRASRRDPHIVSPRSINQYPPGAPALPYHFVTPPAHLPFPIPTAPIPPSTA